MASPLILCPRCRRYARDPDVHLIGPVVAWTGGPLPKMRWCLPDGAKALDFHDVPEVDQ